MPNFPCRNCYYYEGWFSLFIIHKWATFELKRSLIRAERKVDAMRELLDAQGLEELLAQLLGANKRAPFALHLVSLYAVDPISCQSSLCAELEAGDITAGLVGLIRPVDALARLAPGKFAVVQQRKAALSQVESLADKISKEFAGLADVNGNELACTVGTVEFAERSGTPFLLMQSAEAALDAQKCTRFVGSSPFGNPLLAGESPLPRGAGVNKIKRALRDALAEDQLELFYQPVVSAKTGTVVQYEALIRWRHPSLQYVPPVHFIPAAERAGVIAEIGRWALHKACMEILAYDGGIGVAVNLSPVEFLSSDVAATIQRSLEDTGLHPKRLTIELTENVFMSFSMQILKQFERIKDMGVRLSLDDFGAAYSSLARLYALPIKSIKIDRSLITPIAQCDRSRKVIGGIVKLADDLNLTTVAEGVESADQAKILQDVGATWLQGYHFGPPAPAHVALAGQHSPH